MPGLFRRDCSLLAKEWDFECPNHGPQKARPFQAEVKRDWCGLVDAANQIDRCEMALRVALPFFEKRVRVSVGRNTVDGCIAQEPCRGNSRRGRSSTTSIYKPKQSGASDDVFVRPDQQSNQRPHYGPQCLTKKTFFHEHDYDFVSFFRRIGSGLSRVGPGSTKAAKFRDW